MENAALVASQEAPSDVSLPVHCLQATGLRAGEAQPRGEESPGLLGRTVWESVMRRKSAVTTHKTGAQVSEGQGVVPAFPRSQEAGKCSGQGTSSLSPAQVPCRLSHLLLL